MTARNEWRRHWQLVLACSLGFAFFSAMSSATGVFMAPLGKEFGWSVTLQSSGMPISAVTGMLLSPFVGRLFDRFGVRRLVLPGLILNAMCIAAFSLANGSVLQWIALWTLYGLTSLLISSTAWTAAVSGVFDKGLGLAIGLTLAGTAVAQIIIPPSANALIEAYGWRTAYIAIGFGAGGLAIIACALFLHESAGRGPQRRDSANLPGLSISEAWRNMAIWRIAISTFIIMLITIALNVHQFQIMTEAGVSRANAAFYASLVGVAGISGKLATGWLLDRYRPGRVGGLTLCSTSFAFLILLMKQPGPSLIVLAMLINGYGAGSKLQIAGLLTSRYSGLRNFGAIFGMMTTLIVAGSGLGPVLAGLIRDHFNSYAPFMFAGIVGSLVSGFLLFGLPP